MKFNLNNKTAIVTGGGSGIGKSLSKTLVDQCLKHDREAGLDCVYSVYIKRGHNGLIPLFSK